MFPTQHVSSEALVTRYVECPFRATYAKILPLAFIHIMQGNVFADVSLGKVVVSFTHTIKAMESFSVPLLVLFHGVLAFSCIRRWLPPYLFFILFVLLIAFFLSC